MNIENELVGLLANGQRRGQHVVDAARFSDLDRAAAYRIQAGVLSALGESVGMLKTAVNAEGTGVAAPIYASRMGRSGSFRLPSANVTGLELEVGLVLARDLDVTSAADEINVVEAVDHYFVGVEICGTRYRDRSIATPNAGLADNMSALGYVLDPSPRDFGADIDGFDVELNFAGSQIYLAPAKHGFGSVLASLVAYARNQAPAYPLKAGTIITTGSMCGLVPISGTGPVIGKFGAHVVEFDIV